MRCPTESYGVGGLDLGGLGGGLAVVGREAAGAGVLISDEVGVGGGAFGRAPAHAGVEGELPCHLGANLGLVEAVGLVLVGMGAIPDEVAGGVEGVGLGEGVGGGVVVGQVDGSRGQTAAGTSLTGAPRVVAEGGGRGLPVSPNHSVDQCSG